MDKIIQIGLATLILGDGYEELPKQGICQLVMDPPYVLKTQGAGKMRKARKYMDKIAQKKLDKDFDHTIINPLLHPSTVVFCSNRQVPRISTYLDGLYHDFVLCTWQKTNPMPVANKHYQPETEIYFHAWTKGHHPQGKLANLKRVITGPVGRSMGFEHPTIKPEYVMDKIITNVAPGLIADPFMGSGSTLVAAIKQGRRCVGIEHDPEFFAIAVERVKAAQAQIDAGSLPNLLAA